MFRKLLTSAALPTGRPRQIFQTVGTALNVIEVKTYDELVAALGRLYRRGDELKCYGQAISIVADIQVKSSIVLNSSRYSGLRIMSPSRARISPAASAVSTPLFAVSGTSLVGLQLTDFRVDTDADGGVFSDVIDVPTGYLTDFSAENIRWKATTFLTCTWVQNSLLSRLYATLKSDTMVSGRLNSTRIIGCYGGDISLVNETTDVVISANTSLVDVTVGAAGSDVSITGNAQVTSITTSASAGSNVIVGNTNVGTITPHGSDQVANNT